MSLNLGNLRTCSCGATYDRDEARFVGAQACGDGEVAILFTCPACKTTYADGVLQDAAVCHECHAGIAGNFEDRKVAALVHTAEGVESRILCEDCDDKGGLVRRRYGGVGAY